MDQFDNFLAPNDIISKITFSVNAMKISLINDIFGIKSIRGSTNIILDT